METMWMKVTKDKYELPLAVADTAGQLARLLGISQETIYSTYHSAEAERKKGRKVKCKYVKVVFDDDGE